MASSLGYLAAIATPLMAPFNCGKLPILKINNEDKAGSWKVWYRSFKLSIEMISLSLETERVNGEEVRVFRGIACSKGS